MTPSLGRGQGASQGLQGLLLRIRAYPFRSARCRVVLGFLGFLASRTFRGALTLEASAFPPALPAGPFLIVAFGDLYASADAHVTRVFD